MEPNPFMIFAIALAVLALVTYLVKVIWNNVIIEMFPEQNFSELSYWHALAVLVFARILIGSRM